MSTLKKVLVDTQTNTIDYPNFNRKGNNVSDKSKFNKLTIFVIFLLVIWIGGFCYFFLGQKKEKTDETPIIDDVNQYKVDEGVEYTNEGIVKKPDTEIKKSETEIKKLETEIKKPTVTFGSNETLDKEDEFRRNAVKQAFLHAWNGYSTYAWGSDELKPVSKQPENNWGGIGATIIDSLDTMIIMNLDDEVKKAREFVEKLDFDKDYDASLFEYTIRFVGGFLSAYDLTNDKLYLNKAKEVADRLLPAYNTPTGIPLSTVNLKTGNAYCPSWTGGAPFLSEFSTVQLEMKYLSYVTGDPQYYEHVTDINDVVKTINTDKFDGLFGNQIHPTTGQFTSTHIAFGSRGDSFYEYLLKQYLQTEKKERSIYDIYLRAMHGMKKRLLKVTKSGLYYIIEENGGAPVNKMDHLVCFVPGMLILDDVEEHQQLAKDLMYTCWQFYERNPTGIAPEIVGFNFDSNNKEEFFNQAPHYLLRPETVESLFVLSRATGDSKYKEWGWKIFKSIEKYCKTEAGFSALKNVGQINSPRNDDMPSFFMAETLKYLYLLFSPRDFLSPDDYVYNTEAHPLKKFSPPSHWKL